MKPYMYCRRILHFRFPHHTSNRQTNISRWHCGPQVACVQLIGPHPTAAHFCSKPAVIHNKGRVFDQQAIIARQISNSYIPKLFSNKSNNVPDRKNDNEPKSEGIFQRFKNAYKEYGKVLVGVHCATSAVWFGMFYYAALKGIDVVPLLEKMGAGDTVIKPFRSGAGDFAVMYLLYKLATPARYTVTIVGTQYTVKLLRRYGYMDQVPEGDSIRNLMKEGRQQVKDKVDDRKEKLMDKADEMKEKYEAKKDSVKEKIAEKKEKFKDTKERLEERSDRLRDKAEDLSDRFEKEKLKDAVSDATNKLKASAWEMKREMDRDENIQDMKQKLGDTADKVKDRAFDLKHKLEKGKPMKDMKENLDKAKSKVKGATNELKGKIRKK